MPDLLMELVQHRMLARVHRAMEEHNRALQKHRSGEAPPLPVTASAVDWYRIIEGDADELEQELADQEDLSAYA